MEINLNLLSGKKLDLGVSQKLISYYNQPLTYTKHIIEKEINNGHYNDPQFLKIFEKPAVVIDGGANIGLFSLLLSDSCEHIYAIEPTKQHLEVLVELADYYKLNNISFHEIAFNNYNGTCNFMFDYTNTTQNRISDYGFSVTCTTVNDFIKNNNINNINLLKLDIEGGEKQAVLEDSTFKLLYDKCDNIYIEIHPPHVSPVEIINTICSMGYRLKFINSQFLNNNLNVLFYK